VTEIEPNDTHYSLWRVLKAGLTSTIAEAEENTIRRERNYRKPIIETMPPAAVRTDAPQQYGMCCGAFDIGEIEIEVQAMDGDQNSVKSTQIVVSPGSNHPPRHHYINDDGNEPPELTRAESFDSADEIIEGSNEMKLMRRVVEKQRQHEQQQLELELEKQRNGIGIGLERQDSMSDTNSVNSNDVFDSIENSKEMEYLDVLDRHLNQTNPEVLDYEHLNDESEDLHPNKQQFQANLDDIIEHLCVVPCGGCIPIAMDDNPGGYPRSVLRVPKYSSPDQYPPLVNSANTASVSTANFEPPILIRSSSAYDASGLNHRGRNNHSVTFQNVDIRHLKMTLGNHPSATTGPPVMLDGELAEPQHLARQVMTLDKYEKTRPARRKRRQLKLTLQQRHNILVKERGFSFEEVKGAWQQSLQIRKQRRETLERGLAMMKWDEVWESTCRKFNRLVDGTL